MASYPGDFVQTQALPSEAVQELIGRILGTAELLEAAAPELVERVRGVARDLGEEQVTISFGGVFKAGKSTIINAALGRNILPVDDVPETGAICCLLAAHEDSAMVIEGGVKRPIPCTTEAIRSEITLLSAQGERRNQVGAIERAEILLKESPIPGDACWVDSPGYNDTADMDERTRRSAAYADVLAWVLTSRQLLSQVEMEFLTEHLRGSGPASVVFILNGFLRGDSEEEWQRFLEVSAPQLLDKVLHYAVDMGFQEETPLIIPVAGRAMCKGGQNAFGGGALLHFLREVDSRSHPRVMRTRMWRASAILRDCASAQESFIEMETDKLRTLKSAAAEIERAAQKKTSLSESLTSIVDQFLKEFSDDARSSGVEVVNLLTNVAAATSGHFAAQLNRRVAEVAEQAWMRWIARTGETLHKHREAPLSREWVEYFASVTRPPTATFKFPGELESGGISAVAIALPAYIGEKLGRPPQWLARVKEEVQRATEGIIASMHARRARFLQGFDRLYGLQVQETAAPDESPLQQLRNVRERLWECAERAAKLASPAAMAAATGTRGWKQGFSR